jgi:ABC-type dipeptide/oligopeptide/nickel transport system permease component
MCRHVSESLRRLSSTWVTLVALVIFILFTALVLPRQAATAETYTRDAGSLDTSFFYSPDDLYRIAEAYGENGRRLYVRSRFTLDAIWPLVYALFLTTAISWIYRRAFAPRSQWQLANLAPLLAAGFDYLENVSTSLVMLRYPARTPVVDLLAPVFTLTKWTLIGVSFALLLIGLAVGIWRWIPRKR